ncbi:esterase [Phreatobacter oligotrophus]|uniref:Esterase n=1 Tax=Phreatobacter oligotrophus TaxID=1122261 RepID=A0A2T4Z2H2_9HYPH|nr:esterase [Phreatobacter oligotrophus]PTM54953.1 hypothetical protein C8P69_105103 [Phreatobacter oligotrophus]
MNRFYCAVFAGVLALAAVPAMAEEPPLEIVGMGSFHVGGRLAEITGQPVREITFTPGGTPAKVDPNGRYAVEQMYVQWFRPRAQRGRVPLLLWHGGGLSGVTYETTPDGREGWLNWFLRRGWTVYNSDAVERGRSGWAPPEVWSAPAIHVPIGNPFERFRIGQGEGSYSDDPAKRRVLPGSQFPVEAYDQFPRQLSPRWTTTDEPTIAAYVALVDKVCPCVIVFHSQAGQFGFKVAQARPDKVLALVAVEPAGFGDPAKVDVLKSIPSLMIYGDFIEQDSRWPTIRRNGVAFAERIRAAGGSVDVVDLPAAGIRGNSHMLMMDRNSGDVAQLIQTWLQRKGLWQ